MAEKKPERKRSIDEQRAEDLAQGEPEDGSIVLTNDSGEIKRVTPEEWDNEEFQADLLKKGWKVLGAEEE
jgi:hypothetical protein